MKSPLILPIFSHAEVRKAEIQDRPHPMEVHRAHYASALIGDLERHFKATGEVDYAKCDRIERILWPTDSPQREGGGST